MISELEGLSRGLVRRITAADRRTVVLPLYGSHPRRHHPSSIRLSSNMLPVWDRPCKFRTGRRSRLTSIYRDHRNRGRSVQRTVKSQRESRITLNRLQREAIGSCGSVMCKSTSPLQGFQDSTWMLMICPSAPITLLTKSSGISST